jgi:hypothetical protein
MTLQEISRQHQAHLRRFALYLAEEFSGSKAGEWRCPMIGTEAAVGVVEAIDALLASLVIPHEQEKKEDHGAGLIHQTIPDMAGTEPRPNFCPTCGTGLGED